MSSATLAVRQYETASELSERFGCALLDLIRTWKNLPGAEALTPTQIDDARDTTRAVISAIERALTGDSGDTARRKNDVEIPDGFTAWLKATHQGDAVKPDDLARLRGRLADAAAGCDDTDIALLERLSLVLGAQTAHLFSRLTATAERG